MKLSIRRRSCWIGTPFLLLHVLTLSGVAADQGSTVTAIRDNGHLLLRWSCQSNQLFTVQWTVSLDTPTGWMNLTNLEAASIGDLSLTIPMTNATAFYRVVDVSAPGLDPDADGLSNAAEEAFGTRRLSADSDGDGLPDAWEVRFGLDPNSGQGNDGAAGDADWDGISNVDELKRGTNPMQGVVGQPARLQLKLFRPNH